MAILVGYGTGPAVTPVIDVVASALRDAQIVIQDALRVDDGRYWSYRCPDPACCSPDGVPYDPSAHPAAAALAGGRAHRSTPTGPELAGTLARDPRLRSSP